jgi:hypothetical protein
MSRYWILAAAAAFLSIPSAGRGVGQQARVVVYDDWFTDEAMRLDLFHTATATTETVGLDEVVMEPVWAGTRVRLLDFSDFGAYRFSVHDAESGSPIFQQGFSSLLAEWRTTDEADATARTMGESLRFPFPKKPVKVKLFSRDKKNKLHEIFSVEVDPASPSVNRGRSFSRFQVADIVVSGEPEDQVDIVILPDGYSSAETGKMRADAARFASILFRHEPFAANRKKFSIRLVEAISNESGPDEPRKGIFRDTVFDTSFNTFGAERYLTTANNKAIREAAALAPYDLAVVMVNTARYGGGGIYNFWSIFTSDNEYDDYVFVHELGHAFAGLADEYFQAGGGYDEDEFYPPGVEPWEPNLSAFLEGRKSVKWQAILDPTAPLPTPGDEKWKGRVGLFEGAGYKEKGLFRGYLDCKMFHKGLVPFCPVCRRSIEQMIEYYTDGEGGKP